MIRASKATIRTLATVDELTSLANRRHMNEVLGAEERRERGGAQPVCIALLDIDFFIAKASGRNQVIPIAAPAA
jgi:PleD family two-component response regulator